MGHPLKLPLGIYFHGLACGVGNLREDFFGWFGVVAGIRTWS
jgi:hypothetical protein